MKKLSKLLFIFVLGFIPLQTYAWQGMHTPQLHVDGRYLKDPSGKNVILHGWMQPTSSYFNGRFFHDPTTFTPEDCAEALNVYKKVVDLLSNPNPLFGRDHGWYNGFVRIWTPSDGWQNDGTVDEALQDRAWNNMYIPYVEYCKSHGIYVVFIGNCPDGGTYMSAQHKSNMIKFWTRICNRYSSIKNADNVMFEICNEPVAIESQLGNGDWGSNSDAHDRATQAYFQDIVNAIRGTGANNIVWVPGLVWQARLKNFATYPISGSNIGYAGHKYPIGANDAAEITSNFNSDWKLCSDKYPIIVTEGSWNTMDSDQGLRTGTTEVFGNTIKSLYDNAGNINWVCGMTEELIGNMSGGISSFTYPEINCGRAGFDWWPSYTWAAPSDGSCTPTTITPYIQVNDGTWQQTSSVTVNSGTKVKFGPQPVSGGSWSWNGCGISGTSREQTFTANSSCTSTATFTNPSGCTSTQNFTVIVSYVSIKNKATGLFIDGMGRTTNGSSAGQWGNSGSTNQQWIIEPTGSYVKLKNQATGLYLDGMGRTSNGSLVSLWSNSTSNNQQWTIEDIGSYKRIKNSATSLYIDGMGWTTNGSDLGLWGNSSSDAQQWTITSLKSAKENSEELSLVDEKNSDILLFPNPFSSEINLRIDNPEQVTSIVVFDMLGKKVEVIGRDAVKNTQSIGSSLKAGMYVLQICSPGKVQSFKILKK
jgi:hypothetical protein